MAIENGFKRILLTFLVSIRVFDCLLSSVWLCGVQQRFRFSNRENIVIDRKNCIFAIENDIFDCRNALMRFLRIWNQHRRVYPLSLYEPSQSVSSLTWTPISLLFAELVFFFLLLNACELGSFYAILETRRFLWAHWRINIASSFDFHSCTEGSDELAHNYRHKADTQPASNIGPPSAQLYMFTGDVNGSLCH